MATKYAPKDGAVLARVNFPLNQSKLEARLKATNKKIDVRVTLWNVTIDGQEYALVVNGDHRLAACLAREKRPHYTPPSPEFRAVVYERSDDEKLALIRTGGGGSPEWISVETGERIDVLSAPLAVPS